MQCYAAWCPFHTWEPSNTTPRRTSTTSPHTIQLTDLGIQIDNQLKFNNHINDTNRANQRSNLIIRCFLSQDSNSLIRAYKTYVRPLLEYKLYNSVVWSPYHIMSN